MPRPNSPTTSTVHAISGLAAISARELENPDGQKNFTGQRLWDYNHDGVEVSIVMPLPAFVETGLAEMMMVKNYAPKFFIVLNPTNLPANGLEPGIGYNLVARGIGVDRLRTKGVRRLIF